MKKIILFGYGAMGKRAVQLFMADENVELIGISDNRRLKDTPVPFVLPENDSVKSFV